MSSLFVVMTRSTTHTHTRQMNQTTFNFLLTTLLDEIEMHEHKDELLQLMAEQVLDDET